jgi:hypothetical protein
LRTRRCGTTIISLNAAASATDLHDLVGVSLALPSEHRRELVSAAVTGRIHLWSVPKKKILADYRFLRRSGDWQTLPN